MGEAFSRHVGYKNCIQIFVRIPEWKRSLGIGGMIILIHVLKEYCVGVWTALLNIVMRFLIV
jgi:hypothetical protein